MTDFVWHLYIILCRDGTFYTGITKNLEQRIHDHNHGKGCRYTKYRWPVRLVYSELYADRISAIKKRNPNPGVEQTQEGNADPRSGNISYARGK